MLVAVLVAYLIAVASLWIAFAAMYRLWLVEGRLSNLEDVSRALIKRTEPARRAPVAEPF